MRRVSLPRIDSDMTNAEVLVEVRFLDEGDDDLALWIDRYLLRGWDRKVPEIARDVTPYTSGRAPGSRVAVVVAVETMDGRTHHVHTETGEVPGWEGMRES